MNERLSIIERFVRLFSGRRQGMPTTRITVTVTPGPPNGNEVPCQLHVAPPQFLVDDAIWLDPTQDYDITFNMVAGSARTWNVAAGGPGPFCNIRGQCPAIAAGTSDGFAITARGPNAITVHVPALGTKAVQHYRMNFDNNLTCDPIIIVG